MARTGQTTQFQSSNRIKYGISVAAMAVIWSAPAFAQSAPEEPIVQETVAAPPAGPSADDQQAVPPAIQPGDRVIVTARRGMRPEADLLLRLCKQRLPAYMLPSHIELREGNLPRNPNGKIDRKLLSQELQHLFKGTAQ